MVVDVLVSGNNVETDLPYIPPEPVLFTLIVSIVDALVKSPKNVIPDLIRYPEVVEFTGFRLSPE